MRVRYAFCEIGDRRFVGIDANASKGGQSSHGERSTRRRNGRSTVTFQ